MKKLDLLFSKICLATLLSLPIVFTSCSDDNEPVNAPKIANPGIATDTVVAKGSSFVIEPQLSNPSPAFYSWTMNGAEVSKEKNYTFSAATPGAYNLTFSASNEAGTDQTTYTINVHSYFGGFYVVNEGQYGKPGSVCYYSDKKWSNRIFQENNPNKAIGGTTTNGVISGNNIYFVSKESPLLVETSLNDFKQKSTIESTTSTGQANNFCAINSEVGILTTSQGAYKVALNPLGLGQQLSQANNACKDIIKAGKYAFVISTNSVLVYNAANTTFVKSLKVQATTGFAQSKDGSVWAANGNTLFRINTSDLTTENVSLPDGVKVNYNSMAYSPSSLCAATTANALYFVKSDGWNSKDGYRYDIDAKTLTKIVSAPAGYSFYGAGLSMNPLNGYVYAIFTEDGFGDHYKNNKILVVDGSSTTTIETIDYSGEFWFPSVIVFE